MDSHVKVNKSSLHYLKQPRPRISIQLRMSSYAQIHNLRWSKIQARIFYELISIFPSPEGTRIKEGNEQDFFQYYMINNRIRDLSFHYYQEYFSRICGHARITPPAPTILPPHFFKQYRYKENLFLLLHFFCNFSTFNNCAIGRAEQFIFHTKFFYLHVLVEFLYVLCVILILCPIAEVT